MSSKWAYSFLKTASGGLINLAIVYLIGVYIGQNDFSRFANGVGFLMCVVSVIYLEGVLYDAEH